MLTGLVNVDCQRALQPLLSPPLLRSPLCSARLGSKWHCAAWRRTTLARWMRHHSRPWAPWTQKSPARNAELFAWRVERGRGWECTRGMTAPPPRPPLLHLRLLLQTRSLPSRQRVVNTAVLLCSAMDDVAGPAADEDENFAAGGDSRLCAGSQSALEPGMVPMQENASGAVVPYARGRGRGRGRGSGGQIGRGRRSNARGRVSGGGRAGRLADAGAVSVVAADGRCA